MSTDQIPWRLAEDVAKHIAGHPLAPLTASEISRSSDLVKALFPSETNLQFKAVTLEEPLKAQLVPYLEHEHNGRKVSHIDRKAFVSYYIRNTNKFHEAIVNLSRQHVESNVRLGPNIHSPGDSEEILLIEKIALEDEAVKAELAKLQLPEGTVVISDPWIYGSDGVDDHRRMYQCYLYMRDPMDPSNADSNHYAFPLAISPVVDTVENKVIRIDIVPTGIDNTIKETQPYKVQPPNEYTSEHQALRTDLKPLNVMQPEGASFTATQAGETGEIIEWQKWSFRVGFNQREGMVIYDVRYDDRSLFYRLSLSDMNIPYADPRSPIHRKAAFDLGDVGAGTMANNLKLGCDCLGSIHYLSAVLSDDKGQPFPMENVVCVHEQDAGIGWKHTNYRTGRAAVVRNRELVVQSIITVANYEYIMAFIFNQAGEVTYEIRATGILSTQPIDEGIDVPWGTVVHPGVLATYHQHIFSLRVDPAIEGHDNRLVYDEVHPMARSEFNPHGVGYTVKETVVEESSGLDIDYDSNRTFQIQNVSVRNPVNGKPVAYKIHAPAFQKMVSDQDSYNHKRAEFADHNIYVTKYQDGELYAGGKYTNQSRGGEGVRAWAGRKENVKDTDLVVYVQLGLQHIPRIEDFPVMPCEILKVAFKPVNFFDKNPALDVPPSSQDFNQSSLVSQHPQAAAEAMTGALCCISVDIDAVAGWLGSYGGEDSTSDISRGLFAGTVGVRRLLKLFAKYDIRTTWFIPGHSLETFPEECALVRDAGHEIGLHGYSHENPAAMSIEQQHAILDKTYKQLTDFCGKPPRGSVAPWWEASQEGAELMLKYGVEYDHSFSHHDCLPYYLRTGDSWTPIDYSKHPSHWMKPLSKGQQTGLVEIPANWYLDDLPPMLFIKKAPNSHGWVSPKVVEELWRDHFDYFYREHDDFVFPVTIHPDVAGHPHVIFMLERLIEYISTKPGVEWVKMEDICADFKSKNSPPPGALMPAAQGAILQDPDIMLRTA